MIFDAMHALEAKREQLGLPSSDTEISDTCPPYDEEARSLAVVIKTVTACMYVRPPGWFIPYRHLMPICCWRKRQMRYTGEY